MPPPKSVQDIGDGFQAEEHFHRRNPRGRTLSQHQPASRSHPTDGSHSHWAAPALSDPPAPIPFTAASRTARPIESGNLLFPKEGIQNTAPFTTPGPSTSSHASATTQGYRALGIEQPYMAPFPRLLPQTQQLTGYGRRTTLPKSQSDNRPTGFEEPDPLRRRASPQVELPDGRSSRSAPRALVPVQEDVDDYRTGSRQAQVVASTWAPFRSPGDPKLLSRPQGSTCDMPSDDIDFPSLFSLPGYDDHASSDFGEHSLALPAFVDPKVLTLPGQSAGPPHLAASPAPNGPSMGTSFHPNTLGNISADLAGRGEPPCGSISWLGYLLTRRTTRPSR